MQLPNDIKSTLEQLCESQQFLANIAYYAKVGYDYLMTPNIVEESQTQCPTPFLLTLAHYLSCGYPLQNLSLYLPQSVREQYIKAVRVLQKKLFSVPEQNITINLLNDHVGNLKDVKWQTAIENGRQIWVVELIIDNKQDPIVMKLNYQQFSLFSYKMNQIVGHIKSIDLQKIL